MSRRAAAAVALAVAALLAPALLMRVCLAQPALDSAPAGAEPRFAWVDVILDTGEHPLAAYQVEVHDTRGSAVVVGVEGSGGAGGEAAAGGAFADPPYYDPAAMMNDRVIIAALSTEPAERLPTGRTRIARLHVRLAGDVEPDFSLTLHAAAGPDAAAIPATATLIPGEHP